MACRSLYKFTLQKPFGDRRDCKAENSTIVQNAEKAIKIKKRDSTIKIKKRDSAAAEAAVKDNNKSKLRPTSSHRTVSSTVHTTLCLFYEIPYRLNESSVPWWQCNQCEK